MKKIYYFILPAIAMLFSGGCPFVNECDKDCGSNGTLDSDECRCNCNAGFFGPDCSMILIPPKFHASVQVDGKPAYSYDPPDIDIDLYDRATDTLWIEGHDSTDGSYCFLRLYVADHTTITTGATFPINNSQTPGTCWAAFKHPSANNYYYYARAFNGGLLRIDTYNPGTKISGTFDFSAEYLSSTAVITGSFDDK
jgi:hypothetical protein